MQKILFRLSKSAPTACIAALRMKSQVNMNSCLKILLLEDVQDDTLLIERELERAGIAFTWRVVGDRASFCAALCEFQPDVILCDHALPDFNSIEALHVAQERQKERGIVVPFILVTGNVSEEFAIQSMKAGVNDYIIKDRLRRLPHAIQGAIEKCKIENERLQYLREVVAKEALMSEAENLAHFGSWQIDLTTGKQTWSDSTYRIYGFKPREVEPTYELFISLVHPDDADPLKERLLAMRPDSEGDYEFRIIDKQGNLNYLSCKVHIHRQDNGTPFRVVGFNLDVTARKHAEQALARREQEYRSLFDHHPEAVFSLDLHAKKNREKRKERNKKNRAKETKKKNEKRRNKHGKKKMEKKHEKKT